ncbi:D-beta-hydroxybutyrate dehydrogenase-like isoform X2 [Gigantopelta aegis]|uniref:D-beta-hydroxybutyrate dehydrogenase-like isoform X2 n=1 Tax=Gigantopelta aegis TaxID=1735272 RepID=UPI001B8883F7|nr:D-beta-hydroxybutyrate dehydrogenase-like isoform X2 [Gigantopelta aegis]
MEGKTALVTGSTSGIGLGIANHLAEKGCNLILTGLGEQHLIDSIIADFKKKYKGRVDFVPANLSDTNSIAELCTQVSAIYPEGVDILVNNAGIQYVCPIDKYPLDMWNDMMTITVTASFMLIKHFLPKMKERGWGRIVNMSSQMAHVSAVGKAPYSTAKAALIGLTKGVAVECGEYGVTVNAICPGFVDAPMARRQIDAMAAEKGITTDEAKGMFEGMHLTKKAVKISEPSA